MKVRKAQRVAVVILLAGATTSIAQQYEFPFQNPSLPLEQRADDVVSRMTLEEKIAAFANPAVKRRDIPGLGSAEGIHQVVLRAGPGGGMTIPTRSLSRVYGMGETWDPELIQRAGGGHGLRSPLCDSKREVQAAHSGFMGTDFGLGARSTLGTQRREL